MNTIKYEYSTRQQTQNKNKKRKNEHSDNESDGEHDLFKFGQGNSIFPNNWFFGSRDEIITKGNHIWFNTAVTKKSTNQLVTTIHDINADYDDRARHLNDIATLEPKPILLHINSYGGDLLACMAVIDAIKDSRIPIHTIVEGCAASAATLMSVYGARRFMTAHSYMLIHQLSSSLHGKMNEIEDDFENNKVFMDTIKDIYVKRTKMERSEITDALKHDLWWDAYTCYQKGLIDEIVGVSEEDIQKELSNRENRREYRRSRDKKRRK
jgi:ATP-dependent protease ClpP protease subunit